jgi:hypothetical protein
LKVPNKSEKGSFSPTLKLRIWLKKEALKYLLKGFASSHDVHVKQGKKQDITAYQSRLNKFVSVLNHSFFISCKDFAVPKIFENVCKF